MSGSERLVASFYAALCSSIFFYGGDLSLLRFLLPGPLGPTSRVEWAHREGLWFLHSSITQAIKNSNRLSSEGASIHSAREPLL